MTKLSYQEAYKPLHRPAEAQAALGIGNTKFWAMVKENKLKINKIGRAVVVTNLQEFVDELKRTAA